MDSRNSTVCGMGSIWKPAKVKRGSPNLLLADEIAVIPCLTRTDYEIVGVMQKDLGRFESYDVLHMSRKVEFN